MEGQQPLILCIGQIVGNYLSNFCINVSRHGNRKKGLVMRERGSAVKFFFWGGSPMVEQLLVILPEVTLLILAQSPQVF